jgi:hypothetical protein
MYKVYNNYIYVKLTYTGKTPGKVQPGFFGNEGYTLTSEKRTTS